MIGKLKGFVDELGDDHALIDVGGVGYLVECSRTTLRDLPAAGGAATLLIETHVREDAIRLFGFGTAAERGWFTLLLSIQGVGAKVALGVLSILSPGEVAQAAAFGDKAAFARAPGVGPKLAGRIASELKGKTPVSLGGNMPAGLASLGADVPGPMADAASALANLGYAPAQASAAVLAASRTLGDGADTAQLIREGLKELSR